MACALPCCTPQFYTSPPAPRPTTPGARTVVPYGPPSGIPAVVPVRPNRAEVEMAGQMRSMGYQMQVYGNAMANDAANRQLATQRAATYSPWPQYGPPVPVPVPVAVPVPVPYYPACPTPATFPVQPYAPPPPPAYPRGRSATPGPRHRSLPSYDVPPRPRSRPPSRPPSYRRGSFYPYPSPSEGHEVLEDPIPVIRRIEYPRRPKQPRYHGAFYPDYERLSYQEMPRIEPNYVRRRTFSEGMYEDGVVHLDCTIDPPRSRPRSRSRGRESLYDGYYYGDGDVSDSEYYERAYSRPSSRGRSRNRY